MTPQQNGDDSLQALVVHGNLPPADGDQNGPRPKHKVFWAVILHFCFVLHISKKYNVLKQYLLLY